MKAISAKSREKGTSINVYVDKCNLNPLATAQVIALGVVEKTKGPGELMRLYDCWAAIIPRRATK